MRNKARRGLALLLAGVLVVTSLGFTTGNVLKAANSDNAKTEQELEEKVEGAAETATTETPEIKQESIEVGEKTETPSPAAETPATEEETSAPATVTPSPAEEETPAENIVPENETSGATPKAITLTVGDTMQIIPNPAYKNGKWSVLLNSSIVSVDSKGNISAKKVGEAMVVYYSGLKVQNFKITVKASEPVDDGYDAYLYALMPGKSVDGGGNPDNKWYGLGIVKISGVQDPKKVSLGTHISGYSFGTVVKTLYPDITVDGVTYRYAAAGTAEASQYGYYTLTVIGAACADGANSGANGYNTYASNGTHTYHIDYAMSLNSTKTSFVNFAVKAPGSSNFNALDAFAQQVDNGTAESKLRKPGTNAVVQEITRDGKIYKFDGWYTDEACTAKADFGGTVDGNKTYYARYIEKDSYTVKYTDGIDGETVFADVTIKAYKGDVTPAVDDPSREGYVFSGWSPAVASTVSENAVYTATWTPAQNTAYKVQYFYQKNGVYSKTADSEKDRTGTTGAEVEVTAADKKAAEKDYVFDAEAPNVLKAKVAADGSLVLKVYFKEQFTVSYSKGEHGTFETQTNANASYGDVTPAFSGTPSGEAGYEFTGWTPSVADKVSGNVEYVAQWAEKDGTEYRVQYFYEKNGSYSEQPDGYVKRSGKTSQQISVTDEDKIPGSTNYIFDDSRSADLSGRIKGDGTTVLKVYFKEQFTVRYSKGSHGDFETQKYSELKYNDSTPAFEGTPSGDAGYSFKGWSPKAADKVTSNVEYVAQWEADTDTAYKVQYFYEKNGAYDSEPDSEKERKGTTDTNAAVTADDKTAAKDAYVFDGSASNVLSGNIEGDGSLVLKVYFKQQFSVTYQPGLHGDFESQSSTGLTYGAETPEFAGKASGEEGYDFTGWSPKVEKSVTKNIVYIAQWEARTDTEYKVQYFYEKDGKYKSEPEFEEKRTGTTDSMAAVTAADKKPEIDNYIFDANTANVLEETIKGDGSTVLKVYFKEQFTVSYLPGQYGKFAKQTTGNLAYGTKTPGFSGTIAPAAGYEFNGWSPKISDTVTNDTEYVAQWKAKDNTAYKVQYFYQDKSGGGYGEQPDSTIGRTGVTDSAISVTAEDMTPKKDGYVLDRDAANVLSATLDGNGTTVLKIYFKAQFSVTYSKGAHGTFKSQVRNGLDYGAATPEFDGTPEGEAGYEFTGWNPQAADTVKTDIEYVAQWKGKSDTKYTVEYYFQNNGTYSDSADTTIQRSGTTASIVTVTDADKSTEKPGYIFDSKADNVLSSTIRGDGSTVLKVYFKQQFTVKYNPGAKGVFNEQTYKGIDYKAVTPEFDGVPEGKKGYSFNGWTPDPAANVKADAVYTAQWLANDNTEYRVEYYYQTGGQYDAAESAVVRKGTTDTGVSVTSEDRTPKKDGYVFDQDAANVLGGVVDGNGTLVLKVYFKQKFKVTYSKGAHGIFDAQVKSGIDYGTATPEFEGKISAEAGYEFVGWSPAVAKDVTKSVDYIAQWKAKSDTSYKVEYYYQKDGKYSRNADSVSTGYGTTDTSAAVSQNERQPVRDGYVFDEDAENVLSGRISGNGSLVLKVYFKEQFSVSYTPGEFGSFRTQTIESLDYGEATPDFTRAITHAPGYSFAGWKPAVAEKVSGNAVYEAQWKADTDTKYTVEFYYQDMKTGQYSADPSVQPEIRKGTTASKVSVTSEDKKPKLDDYVLDESKTDAYSGAIAGDGSLVLKVYFKAQYTVKYTAGSLKGAFETKTFDALDYGAETPAYGAEPSDYQGYHFVGWSKAIAKTVSGNVVYEAKWAPDSDTEYKVEFYFQKDGKYGKADSVITRTGITDSSVYVTDDDLTTSEDGYAFDENNTENVLYGKIKGDATTVLKVYFKQQFTVKYTAGEYGTFDTQTTEGLSYGSATPVFKGTLTSKPGYHFTGWNPKQVNAVTENTEYVAQWAADEDTSYTVKYLGYDGNGGWTELEKDKLSGVTDEAAKAASKTFDGYTFYEEYPGNKLEGKIAGDGSLVLEVYYKANVQVGITGNCTEQKYCGEQQTVEGYELTAKTDAEGVEYDLANVRENASISKIATGTDAGVYAMGLDVEQFRNADECFNVEFVLVSDGQLEITKRKVVLTSASASKKYDGKPLMDDRITVSGDGFVQGEGFIYSFTGSQTKVGKSNNVFKCGISEELNTKEENYDLELAYGVLEVVKADEVAGGSDNENSNDGNLDNNSLENDGPDEDSALEYGSPGGDGTSDRSVVGQIADGDGYSLTEIGDAKVPLAKQMLDANCCILHLLLMLGALGTLAAYTSDMKKRQTRIHELEATLARSGEQV